MKSIQVFKRKLLQMTSSLSGCFALIAEIRLKSGATLRAIAISVPVVCLFSVTAWPQASTEPKLSLSSSEPIETSQIWVGNLGFEPVGDGDLIFVSVTGCPELTRSYRVPAGGHLLLPLLHNSIAVAGLVPTSISKSISDELRREQILVDPTVSVAVLEYRSRFVSVVGAVKLPGTQQAVGDFRLLDAIARAQGIAPEAGPEIVISQPTGADGTKEMIHITIKDLLQGRDPSLNIPLRGGEIIRVPDAPKLYVVGNVKMPGAYPLNEIEGSSVLKALALSQGTLPYTAREAYIYRQVPGASDRQEIAITLSNILHRKAPDVLLKANDILYIPDNSKLRINVSVLEHIAGFGASTASGLIIWH